MEELTEEQTMETNDSDDASSSDEEEKVLESRAANLEQQIVDNKYLYEVHVELVDLYSQLGDLKSMRAAYERFAEVFPLTPTLWLAWLKKEIKLATTPLDKEHVISIFDKAIEDYMSVELWVEYAQFSIGSLELDKTRAILERGLNSVGLHVAKGSLLWDTLRELELALTSASEELTDPWRQNIAKVAEAFRRQLSVPLLDMDATYNEWQAWLEQLPSGHGVDPQKVKWAYQQASKQLDTYKPFEDRLRAAKNDGEILFVYREYITAMTDPAVILCLYERAVAQVSLNAEFWKEYCNYAMKLGEVSLRICKRALRNCPWSEDLWVKLVRILELQQSNDKEVMECLEEGLAAITPTPGLELWLSYLEYVRRTSESPERLHKLFLQASKQLGEVGDPSYKLPRLQARLYGRQGDMPAARRVWSHMLHNHSYKSTATAWLEYVSLERQYGDAHQLRVLFQRALSACKDWPQCLAEEWLMYERECGSLEEVLKCEAKCAKVIREQEVYTQRARPERDHRKRSRETSSSNHSKLKRLKIEEKPPKNKVAVADIIPEKAVFLSNMRADIDEIELQKLFPNAVRICIPTDRNGISKCYAYVQFEDEAAVAPALARDREPIDGRPLYISVCKLDQTNRKGTFKYSPQSENNKLFVRGLPLKHTQKDVEAIFEPYSATAVRLVLQKSGQPKGLAYVDFADDKAAEKALKATDKLQIGEHIISVAISAPPPKKSSSYNSGLGTSLVPTHPSRSRLQVPLVPRTLQKQTASFEPQGPSKTNDDFRKMLLNK